MELGELLCQQRLCWCVYILFSMFFPPKNKGKLEGLRQTPVQRQDCNCWASLCWQKCLACSPCCSLDVEPAKQLLDAALTNSFQAVRMLSTTLSIMYLTY